MLIKSDISRGARLALLALPLAAGLAALLLWPLATLALRSLAGPGGWTLTAYLAVLGDGRYWRALGNTAALALASTAAALLLCTPAALYLEAAPGAARRLLATLLSIPLSLPGIVVGFFVILLFGRTGALTQLAERVWAGPVDPLAYSFWGLLIGYSYFQIPRVLLVLRGAAAAVSYDTLAVARTLGARPWQVYGAVILPALRPALLSAASLSVATAFGAFGTAATLSRGYRVLPLEIAAAFTERFEPTLAAALSVLLSALSAGLLGGMTRLDARRAAGEE